MNVRCLWIFLSCLIWVTTAAGQSVSKQVTEQQLVWYAYFNTLEFNEKWFLTSEIQERRFRNPDKQHQLLFRSHLHYVLGNNWDVSAGFTYFLQSPQDPLAISRLVVPELRPHIQFDHKQPLGRLTIVHRYRAEKRFFRNFVNDELVEGYNTNYRFRYRLGLDYHVVNINKQPLKLKISDELHVNAGSNITYNRFDQNRLYVGVNYSVLDNLNIEAGYLHWYQQRQAGNQFYDRDIIRFLINHRIKLKKEKESDYSG
jgi:hypothetical protein